MPLSSSLFAPMVLTQSQEVNPMKIPHPGELRQLVEIGRTVHEINNSKRPSTIEGFCNMKEENLCRIPLPQRPRYRLPWV